MPVDVKSRHHALTLDETDDAASLDTAFAVVGYFGLKLANAKGTAAEVGSAVLAWRGVAATHGLTPAQMDRMATAFEHEDLKKAVTRSRAQRHTGNAVAEFVPWVSLRRHRTTAMPRRENLA